VTVSGRPTAASPAAIDGCERCGKPTGVCVCDKTVPLANRTYVLILQHPQEQDVVLGSAPLLALSLQNSDRLVGLSWPSLAAILGQPIDPLRWAVMYPGSLKRPLQGKPPFIVLEKSGEPAEDPGLDGLIVLDGTWSQAKALWWRNAWLLKLRRLLVHPTTPSIYGKARKEPRREYVSTLEAAALALDGLGEDPEIGNQLRRLFRTMVQRARDTGSDKTKR
jgi:DTW domain-containing protein YfiP